MPSESQWNAILNASLRIHRSSSVIEAGEEALYALKEVLSTDNIELTLLEAAPSESASESCSLQRSVDAGPEHFLHFKANYSDLIPKVETQCFDVIIKHVICASRRLPPSSRETSIPISFSANEMQQ